MATPLERVDRSVVVFSGNFGSGKSEVAVNAAMAWAAAGEQVTIVDLDVVNPYFRCREAREDMEREGVRVVAPAGDYAWSDLPIILPEVRGAIRQHAGRVILDVGGDDLGARALASFREELEHVEHHFLMVHNARRPFTNDVPSSLATLARIEAAAGLRFTGLAGNTHLMQETTLETLRSGALLLEEVARARGLPVMFVTAEERLAPEARGLALPCPLLPLVRRLRPPWLGSPGIPRPGRPVGTPPSLRLPVGPRGL